MSLRGSSVDGLCKLSWTGDVSKHWTIDLLVTIHSDGPMVAARLFGAVLQSSSLINSLAMCRRGNDKDGLKTLFPHLEDL